MALNNMAPKDSIIPNKQHSSIPKCGDSPISRLKISSEGRNLILSKNVASIIVRDTAFRAQCYRDKSDTS